MRSCPSLPTAVLLLLTQACAADPDGVAAVSGATMRAPKAQPPLSVSRGSRGHAPARRAGMPALPTARRTVSVAFGCSAIAIPR
jgi:hypothetical protein